MIATGKADDCHSSAESLDPAKSMLGGRNPAAMTVADIEKMTPAQQLQALQESHAQGKKDQKDSSLKIRIELDLDVEIHLTARVKGDIVIGLL